MLEVSDSGYLLYLPLGAIGPLGTYDVECTLKLQLCMHWMALELILG